MISEAEKKFLIRYAIYRLIGLLASVLYFYIIDSVNYFDIIIMIILPFAVFQLLNILNGSSPVSFYTTIHLLVYKYIFGGDEMGLYFFFIFLAIISFAIIYDEMEKKHILIFIYKLIKRKIKGSDTNE